MTPLTERYLAAVLRGIPERQRADVDRELRSSIGDAVEDRVEAGEDRAMAERTTLEALGDPARLAASYSGRPQYLIGPEMFPAYRSLVVMLVSVVVPIVAVVLTVLEIIDGASYINGLLAGTWAAFATAIHMAFWVTLVFALIERTEALREARTEIVGATRSWNVSMLPEESSGRISLGDTIGEIFTTLITIGGLLLLRDTSWFTASGGGVQILDPALSEFWLPMLILVLLATAALQVVVHVVGRWTVPAAAINGLLTAAFAVPVVWLALNGLLVNPAFAAEVGWPELAAGDQPVMLIVAASTTLVSLWEVIGPFLKARRSGSGPERSWNEQVA